MEDNQDHALREENRIVSDAGKSLYAGEAYQRGFTMQHISKVRRNETSPTVYHKTMNYGDCILEKRAASSQAGMQERIFLNTKGQLCRG